MISGDELAFVRLAMRKRLLRADQVKQAVERKKWDTPDRTLRSILVDMGALRNDDVVDIAEELRKNQRRGPRHSSREQRTTQVGRDTRARESDEEQGVPSQLGNYKLIKLLGAGAMGAVYDALNVELHREVALKLLLAEGAPNPRAIQRFKREARLAARLDHPNVVRVHEAGQDQGYHYIAMDKVVGHSVAELITLGEIPVRRAVHLMRRVCEAVAYAHEREVIHRDLKPANILVDERSGEARVTDFGLAVMAEASEDDRLTRTGAAVGTPAYMAPEQVRGQLDKIDARTDVYALGATFYEMLTSRPPFEASTFLELAKQICEAEPASPRRHNREIPMDVETICLKALEKRKEDRYQSAADMARDLAAFLDDTEIKAQRPSLGARFVRFARRRPALVAGLLGILAVALVASGFYLSLPGVLEVSTDPAGAEVWVDGKARGATPERPEVLRLELAAGEHEVRFKKEGYLDVVPLSDTVQIDHNQTATLSVSLMSVQGTVKVRREDVPAEGARLRIYRSGESQPMREAALPFTDTFKAGVYEAEVSAPGYHPARRTFKVLESRLTEPFRAPPLTLEPDPTEQTIEADPEGVQVAWSRAERRFPAPLLVRGAGRHVVVGHKAGYLPRRRELIVPEGSTGGRARLALAPLVAARRALEGRLLGAPLLADVDGDGALDVVALERTVRGRRLVLLGGMGEEQPRYRVPTEAERLLGARDLDGDGDLDLVLGGPDRVEVREGERGALLVTIPLDGRRVAVVDDPPLLAYTRDRPLELVVRPLSLATAGATWSHTLGLGEPPVFLPRSRQVVAARRGQLELRSLQGAARKLDAPGLEPTSALHALTIGEQEAVLGVPRRGPARLVLLDGKGFELGDAQSRFAAAGVAVLPQGTWAFLRDAQGRTQVFVCTLKGVKPVELPGAGLPVVLETGDPSRVWTTSGFAYRVDQDGWHRDELASTEAEGLLAPGAWAAAGDLDGDGDAEVAAVSRDRAAVLMLEPDGDWLRWRAHSGGVRRVALGLGEGAPGLGLVEERRLRFISGEDGRELAERELLIPGEVLAVAVEEPGPDGRSGLYVAYRNPSSEKEAARPALLQRYRPAGNAWKPWPQAFDLTALPRGLRAVDHGSKRGVLVAPPLAFVEETKDLVRELWRDAAAPPRPNGRTVAPLATGGNRPMWIGGRKVEGGAGELLVGYDATAGTAIERALQTAEGAPTSPLRLVGGNDRLVGVATDQAEVQVLRATDLAVAARVPLRDETLAGAALSADPLPRLVLSLSTRRADEAIGGSLLVVDAEHATRVWERALPPGAHPPGQPLLVGSGDRQAVAVVAPSGVVLLFALADGSFLGERRAPEGSVESLLRLDALGEGKRPGLLLETSEDQLLAVELPSLVPRQPSLRQKVQALRRAVRARGAELAGALRELELLAQRAGGSLVLQALAEAYLESGRADEALRALDRAQEGGQQESPALMRVRIVARYVSGARFEEVQEALRALQRLDARQASSVALQLARLRRGDEERRLIELATELDQDHAAARAALGSYLLRHVIELPASEERPEPQDLGMVQWALLGNRWWRGLTAPQLRDASGVAAKARLSLLFALQLEDDDSVRAEAIVAAALERALLLEILARSGQRSGAIERLYAHATEALALLAAGGPATAPRTLQVARRLRELGGMNAADRSAITLELYAADREWLVALVAIHAFTKEP
ncbi:MAG: protein kinase [Planctomycetota bacterium]